jgi:O-antigen/teichoic acid export membrane protein
MSLRKKTFTAVRWTTIDAVGKALLRVVSIAVLARILVPEDYGLIAIVTVILGFASLFADLGVNSAFVQRQEVNEEQRASLFWLNVLVSIAISLIVVALSSLLAGLYGDPRLEPLIVLTASIFVLRALGQQVKMSAEKELRFQAVVTLDFVAALIGFVTAVLGALAGWGVYALAVSGIVGAASATLFYWLFVADGWRPALRLRFGDVRSFLGFGSAAVASNFVNYFLRSVDIFLGGRLLEASTLGLYSVPRTLVLEMGGMINAIVTRVGFPLIAQVQGDIVKVRSIYLQTLNMTAATNAPLYIGIAFFAPDVVYVLLGPGWERSASLLQVLALWGGIRSTGNPVGSLLYGMGRADLSLKWSIGVMLIMPPAIWLGSQRGPEGIAYALLFTQLVLFVPAWFTLVRPLCRARLLEYSKAALGPYVSAALAVTPAFLLASLFESAVVRLMIGVLVSAPSYLLLSYFANRVWFFAMMELAGRPMDSIDDYKASK